MEVLQPNGIIISQKSENNNNVEAVKFDYLDILFCLFGSALAEPIFALLL